MNLFNRLAIDGACRVNHDEVARLRTTIHVRERLVMLAQVEQEARARGCCKITLEVLSNNVAAIEAYRHAGFKPYGLDPKMGSALFFEKKFY